MSKLQIQVYLVHYRLHKPLVPILSYLNPVHIFPLFSLRSILILSSHQHLGLPSWSLIPSDHLSDAWYITCPSHPP
jgi:hypothetical protein